MKWFGGKEQMHKTFVSSLICHIKHTAHDLSSVNVRLSSSVTQNKGVIVMIYLETMKTF